MFIFLLLQKMPGESYFDTLVGVATYKWLSSHWWAEPRTAAALLQGVKSLLAEMRVASLRCLVGTVMELGSFVGLPCLLGLFLTQWVRIPLPSIWKLLCGHLLTEQKQLEWPPECLRRTLSAHFQGSVSPVWQVITGQLSTSALERKFCENNNWVCLDMSPSPALWH